MKSFIYVANWKLYKNFNQAKDWCYQNFEEIDELAKENEIVICPEATTISTIQKIFSESKIYIGAQNCSAHESGAYTGEISPESLRDLGVSYCILGHSERRKNFGETSKIVAQKVVTALRNEIAPILCVSNALQEELIPVLEKIISQNLQNKNLIVAYEPLHAIGTGKVATNEEISGAFEKIKKIANKITSEIKITLLYGGSVDENSVISLKKVNLLGGFLIGRASTDFQELKKIVSFS